MLAKVKSYISPPAQTVYRILEPAQPGAGKKAKEALDKARKKRGKNADRSFK